MPHLLITDVFKMTREERDTLTDQQVLELAYGIEYYEPSAGGIYGDAAIQARAIQSELSTRLDVIRAAKNRPASKLACQAARIICRKCGQPGQAGQHPFSTLPDGGVCDDCI